MINAIFKAELSLEDILMNDGNRESKNYVAHKVTALRLRSVLKKTQKENASLREEIQKLHQKLEQTNELMQDRV